MKKSIFYLLLLSILSVPGIAQMDTSAREYRHELGTDGVAFASQFLNSRFTMEPLFLVSYRYYFSRFNLRAGLGGSFQQSTSATYSISGILTEFTSTYKEMNMRFGFERVEELSKRWQAFYGLDLVGGYNAASNPASYLTGGILYGNTSKSLSLGLAPLLGIRFRINDRMSLITEASFWMYYLQSENKSEAISTDPSLFPLLPESPKQIIKSYQSRFYQPTSLFFVVSF